MQAPLAPLSFRVRVLTRAYTPLPAVVSAVNDGGLSWLRKSYQRMREQAEREQRSLDDIVAQRYGVSYASIQTHTVHACVHRCYGVCVCLW